MRCIACNKNLNDFESTRKSTITGEYLDLCNTCYHEIQQDTSVKERDDLRTDDEVYDDNDDTDLHNLIDPL